jgi:hypothetical protein
VINDDASPQLTIRSAKRYLASTRPVQPLLRCLGYARAKLFDWRHNVETCGITLQKSGGIGCVQYAATHPRTISAMLRDLDIRHQEFVFIDIGSGKGRVLLGASEYPFKRVSGIEIDQSLHEIAMRNITQYRSATKRCPDVESVCCDATEYEFPPEPTVLYLFNPFGPEVADRVFENLAKSLNEHPREIILINLGARLEPCIGRLGGIRLIKQTQYHKIFGIPGSKAGVGTSDGKK